MELSNLDVMDLSILLPGVVDFLLLECTFICTTKLYKKYFSNSVEGSISTVKLDLQFRN